MHSNCFREAEYCLICLLFSAGGEGRGTGTNSSANLVAPNP